jgi:hypothetical protein
MRSPLAVGGPARGPVAHEAPCHQPPGRREQERDEEEAARDDGDVTEVRLIAEAADAGAGAGADGDAALYGGADERRPGRTRSR